jgi:hypothetical protein
VLAAAFAIITLSIGTPFTLGVFDALVTREHFWERVLGTAYDIVFFTSCIGIGAGLLGGRRHPRCARLVPVALPGIHGRRRQAVMLALTLCPRSQVPLAVPAERLAV